MSDMSGETVAYFLYECIPKRNKCKWRYMVITPAYRMPVKRVKKRSRFSTSRTCELLPESIKLGSIIDIVDFK